ncbi:MAG: hypothetical protein J5I92_06860 [Thiogranum sp.]|nr:hypothetical protein [Thiogranum sp.]
MYSESLRPGLALGAYPERERSVKGGFAALVHNASGLLPGFSRGQQQRAGRFCAQVNEASLSFARLDTAELGRRARELRQSLARNRLSEPLAVQCFALVREAASRTLGQRHFDTQIIGGWALLNGMVAEMETGEGKTLMATLPACTAAMAGIPVHVITANDYLVERDADAMSPVYRLLGIRVGTVTANKKDPGLRRDAYACDITYCTGKQVAFDYLRDRLSLGHRRGRLDLQLRGLKTAEAGGSALLLRGLCFAIVDEADSVLIDNAGTPFVLARDVDCAPGGRICSEALNLAEQLEKDRDFRINGKYRDIEMTKSGNNRLASLVPRLRRAGVTTRQAGDLVIQALRAQHCYRKDRDYLVQGGKVQIIDDKTGRAMPDHAWEQGLHQMIETREGCRPTADRKTIARMTYQRMFRRYLHLCGMTGTAREVTGELWSVYGLGVFRIKPRVPVQRMAGKNRVLPTAAAKWEAVAERVRDMHNSQRPVLVGTASVADSEHLSRLLQQRGLRHAVLNARQDRSEAEIIALAGQPGAITVATNMAGRGTDIRLAQRAVQSGGLHVIATARNEARRIDRQLFGRCGRQGDPGSFEAIVSLEDEIFKKYLPDALTTAMQACIRRHLPIPGCLLTRVAQFGAERHHAGMRRRIMEMDRQFREILGFSGPME